MTKIKKATQAVTKYKGSCLCGAITFTFTASLDDIWFCHCSNCRKNYGTYGAFAGVPRGSIAFDNSKKIKHYHSETRAIRSFCSICGSPISWIRDNHSVIYVLLGLLAGKVRIKKANHIWVGDKGEYYKICDNFPQHKTQPKP